MERSGEMKLIIRLVFQVKNMFGIMLALKAELEFN